jgi:hypothetical protein
MSSRHRKLVAFTVSAVVAVPVPNIPDNYWRMRRHLPNDLSTIFIMEFS